MLSVTAADVLKAQRSAGNTSAGNIRGNCYGCLVSQRRQIDTSDYLGRCLWILSAGRHQRTLTPDAMHFTFWGLFSIRLVQALKYDMDKSKVIKGLRILLPLQSP